MTYPIVCNECGTQAKTTLWGGRCYWCGSHISRKGEERLIEVTVNDFLKRLTEEDKDKMIIFSDGKGWSNVWFKKTDNNIIIYCEDNAIFSDDK